MLSESEHSHAHHHGTGIRWLDMIVAVSAIFISVVSLVISIEHGRTMERMVQENEKMVAGSTMPFLTFTGNQIDPLTNERRLRLILKNGGVGPARVDWFELRYKDVPYSSIDALLRACCSAALPKNGSGIIYSNVSGTMIPQRESVDVIDLRPEVGPELITALDEARKDLTARACYCSVLEECWEASFNNEGAASPRTKVEKCQVPSRNILW